MTNLAPIVLFVYKRPVHTKQTIEYLKLNNLASQSDLFIFSEKAKTSAFESEVQEVRNYLKTITGFKSVNIVERPTFLGLATSVISGVSSVFEKYDKVIVLEDDIVTSPHYLEYMNEGLEKYKNEKKIYSITGFCYPPNLFKIYPEYDKAVCLLPRANSWGWGTWADRWKTVDWDVKDFDQLQNNRKLQKKYDETGGDKSRMLIQQQAGEIDSWAIRWDYAHYKNHAYCVFPTKSLINNIGLDNSGTHTKNLKSHQNTIIDTTIKFPSHLEVDPQIIDAYKKIYKRGGYMFKMKRMFSRFKNMLLGNNS